MSERSVHMPAMSRGEAPGRGRLNGRRLLVVGGGQMDIGEDRHTHRQWPAMSVLCAREGAGVAVADRDLRKVPKRPSRMIAREKGRAFMRSRPMRRKKTTWTRMVDEAFDAHSVGSTGSCSMSASARAGRGSKARRRKCGTACLP
jgi:hypothetical protein